MMLRFWIATNFFAALAFTVKLALFSGLLNAALTWVACAGLAHTWEKYDNGC